MDFWNNVYYGNTLLTYAIVLGIILGSVIAAKLLYWISSNVIKKITAKTKTKLDDIIIDKVEEPVMFGLILTGSWYAISMLKFAKSLITPEEYIEYTATKNSTMSIDQFDPEVLIPYPYWENFVHHLFGFLLVVNITWLVVRLFDALIEEYVVPLTEKSESDLDDQLLPIFRKGMKVVVWTLGVVMAMNNAGYDVGAIIAGLGIGGLAFALAAKDTMANFFGGIMIFADKPFTVGDRIKVGGIDGSVVEIGIRSTRISTLEGRMVTVPNSMFTGDAVENVTKEPHRKVVLNLGLTYDTTPEKIEEAIAILTALAEEKRPQIQEDFSVGFNAFGDFALGIIFIYWITKDEDILGVQTDMNLEILKRLNGAGIEMAFPTQTVYHQALK